MKIDYSKVIEGFDAMNAEDKVKAMMEYEVADPDYSGYVSKAMFDKTASELATAKKELKSHLSQEEIEKQARDEEFATMKANYDALMKENTVSKYTARLSALGYDEPLAKATAQAMADGDMDKVFENQATFKSTLEQTIKEDVWKDTPRPGKSGSSKTMTKENLMKMSLQDRLTWGRAHQEDYQTIMEED